MELSPFPHQGPLSPEQVRGRDELVADLIERATARRVTAVLGPRRFGKTSVLRKVESILEEASTSTIWLDLYAATSYADLVVRFDTALAATRGSFRQRVDSLAASASLNLGMLRVEFSKPPAKRPDPEASLHLLLDVLVSAATSSPTVVIIDEFQGLTGVQGAAGLLRTKLQHHVQDIGLLFAGSEPSVMASMFSDREQPFYGQADLVEIEPFSLVALQSIVDEGFSSTGRDAAGLAGQIHDFTQGHPYRSMQIADEAWRLSPTDEPTLPERWADTLENIRRSTTSGLEALFTSFSGAERVVLRSRASDRPLFGASLKLYGVSSGAMTAARDRLVEQGTLTNDHEIVDPLLADWVQRRFPL